MKTWKKLALAFGLGAGLPLASYLAFFNYTEAYETGLAWNRATGELWVQSGGMHFTSPWVAVSRIDTRPQRVCISTAGKGFSCKLVQFGPKFYKEFVATEGHRYYWWANRVSFNWSYAEEYRGMHDLLRGYAYGSVKYPFITILEEVAQ